MGGFVSNFYMDSFTVKYEQTTLISSNNSVAKSKYKLINYPDPFKDNTLISYNLPNRGMVKLNIIDITGMILNTLVSSQQSAGSHK